MRNNKSESRCSGSIEALPGSVLTFAKGEQLSALRLGCFDARKMESLVGKKEGAHLLFWGNEGQF